MSQEQNFIEIASSSLGSYSYCPTCGIDYGNESSFCITDGTKLILTTRELKKRTLFAEKYEILEHLGTGGMGAVYKVRQILIDKIYAIKIIPADLITEQLASRFEREARTMATLENQNLVSIVDFGIWQKQPFMVMELIEGKTLASIIANSPMDTDHVVSVFRQVLNGLSHAHSKGILHRDIKPSNIMICAPNSSKDSDSAALDRSGETAETGRVVILDFGIAKKFGSVDHQNVASSLDLTRTGEMVGSPLYMSPEQARGDILTPSSDLYSLGCALYESLCGTPPFIGKTPIETMMLHLEKDPLPLKEASLGRDFPAGLERVVRKLLAKDPLDRYQSADEVKRALYLAHQLNESDEKSQLEETPETNRVPLMLIAAISLFSLGLIAFLTLQGKQAQSENVKIDLQVGGVETEIAKASETIYSDVPPKKSLRKQKGIPDSEGDLILDRSNKPTFKPIYGNEDELHLPKRKLTPDEVSLIEGDRALLLLGLFESTFPPQMLGKLSGLVEVLNLGSTKTSDEDLKYVGKNLNLSVLSLKGCQVTGSGLHYLSKLTELENLDLTENPFQMKFLRDLHNSRDLHVLSLSRVSGFDESAAKLLVPLKNLKVLNLDDTTISSDAINVLATMPRLTNLSMKRIDLGDKGLDGFKTYNQIQVLQIPNNGITISGIKKIAHLKHLRDLDLSFNDDIDDECVDDILKLQNLQVLRLSHTEITPQGILKLAKLKRLKKLFVRKIRNFNEDHAFQFMSLCPSLSELTFVQQRKDPYTRAEYEINKRKKEASVKH